jgi:predicted DNA-binding transcriptional regulator AlpA
MRAELQNVLTAAKELPTEQLPRLLGELEEIRCTAIARLSAHAPTQPQDQLLDVEAAAQTLGVSKDYLYRHSTDFSFTRRMGKALRFSSAGIQDYLGARGMPSPRRRSRPGNALTY